MSEVFKSSAEEEFEELSAVEIFCPIQERAECLPTNHVLQTTGIWPNPLGALKEVVKIGPSDKSQNEKDRAATRVGHSAIVRVSEQAK